MSSTTHHFDESIEYKFRVEHPHLNAADGSLESFHATKTYAEAIWSGIKTIEEFDLPWLELSHDGGWSRRLTPETLWARCSGILICRNRAVFRDDWDEARLQQAEQVLRVHSWGWSFSDSSNELDGMAHRYIAYQLKPTLRRVFESCESLEYHLFNAAPDIPAWLDAEYLPSQQVLVVYGAHKEAEPADKDDGWCSRSPHLVLVKNEAGSIAHDRYRSGNAVDARQQTIDDMTAEIGIAMHIQSAYGAGEANAWVRMHRELSASENLQGSEEHED